MSKTTPEIVRESPADTVAFFLLAPLMLAWYAWCLLRGRMQPRVSLVRALICTVRGPMSGTLGHIEAEEGHCYRGEVPRSLMGDANGCSSLQVLEGGRPIGPAHADHDAIRVKGAGRFCHWDEWVWFSSSDNTDPRTNGRNYTFREEWT